MAHRFFIAMLTSVVSIPLAITACNSSDGEGTPYCSVCQAVSDCVNDNATVDQDEDNWSCASGLCNYEGCNSDEECEEAFPGQGLLCSDQTSPPSCQGLLPCSEPVDCVFFPEQEDMNEDNWECGESGCIYLGCHSSDECIEGLECLPLEGFSYQQCQVPGGDDGQSMPCETAADCFDPNYSNALFDEDNWICYGGECRYKGCNNDEECAEVYGEESECM